MMRAFFEVELELLTPCLAPGLGPRRWEDSNGPQQVFNGVRQAQAAQSASRSFGDGGAGLGSAGAGARSTIAGSGQTARWQQQTQRGPQRWP
jgi:hypothetical protein